MNIFKERNAFHQWLLLNEMKTSGIVLWHALMDICNKVGRKPSFNVPNTTLMKLTGLSKRTLIDARAILIEHHLIRYTKGKKGTAPVYEMISFEDRLDLSSPLLDTETFPQSITQSGTESCTQSHTQLGTESCTQSRTQFGTKSCTQFNTQSGTQSITQSNTETRPILKDKGKGKEKRGGGGGVPAHAIEMYEQNFGNMQPVIQSEMETWCEVIGEEMVMEAMAIAVKKGGRTFSYVEKLLMEWVDAEVFTPEEIPRYEQGKNKHSRSAKPAFYENQSELFAELVREELSS